MSQIEKNKSIQITDKSIIKNLTMINGQKLYTDVLLEDDPILIVPTYGEQLPYLDEHDFQYPVIALMLPTFHTIDSRYYVLYYYLENNKLVERYLGQLTVESSIIISNKVAAIIGKKIMNGSGFTPNMEQQKPQVNQEDKKPSTSDNNVQDMKETDKKEGFDFTITDEDDILLYTQLFKDTPSLKNELLSLIKEGGTLELKINKVIDDNYQVAYRFPGLSTDRTVQTYIENMIKNNKDSYDEPLVKFVIKQFKKEVINDFFNSANKEFDGFRWWLMKIDK